MCMTVSIEEYREGWKDFTIEGEYVKPDGSEGLIVKSRYGSFYAIRNASGSDYKFFETLPDAQWDMEKHGFTLKGVVQGLAVGEVVTDEARDVTEYLREREAQVQVQGRTLAEWEEQGKINATLPPEQRVHPTHIDDSEDELTALVNSMTEEEAVGTFLVLAASAQEMVDKATNKKAIKKTRSPRRQRVSA